MKFELVRLQHNGSIFHGIVDKKPMTRGTAIHVHGMGGNFYENELVEATLAVYDREGFSTAALNFPGYDGSHKTEDFTEFTPVLDAWIDIVAPSGPLILQGHSLGVHKVLSYATDDRAKHRDRVGAISLLAAFDPVMAWGSGEPGERAKRLAWVNEQLATNDPKTVVFDESFMHWPMSLGTLNQLMTEGSLIDEFRVRDGLPSVAWENKPVFIAVGEDDIYCKPSPAEVVALANKFDNVSAYVIPGGDHGFIPNLVELEKRLDVWIESLHGKLQ